MVYSGCVVTYGRGKLCNRHRHNTEMVKSPLFDSEEEKPRLFKRLAQLNIFRMAPCRLCIFLTCIYRASRQMFMTAVSLAGRHP